MNQILITGATGTVGSQVVESLLQAGVAPRIGVRSPEKGSQWHLRGCKITPFDFDRPETLHSAMRGMEVVFLLTPLVEDPIPLVEDAVNAAIHAGVRHIVRLSVMGANPEMNGPIKQHGECDQILQQSGLGWTLIQPTFFQDNLLNYAGPTIKSDNAFYGCAGEGRIAYVSAADIARISAMALLDPGTHANQAYELTGPEAPTEDEVAALLSELLGRQINYVSLDLEQYAEGLRSSGMPEWMVRNMLALEQIKANGWASAVTDVIPNLTGTMAYSMRDYLGAHIQRLA